MQATKQIAFSSQFNFDKSKTLLETDCKCNHIDYVIECKIVQKHVKTNARLKRYPTHRFPALFSILLHDFP